MGGVASFFGCVLRWDEMRQIPFRYATVGRGVKGTAKKGEGREGNHKGTTGQE